MMFGLFKKKLLPRSDALEDRPVAGKARPRGVLPTLVTAQDVVLCKAAPLVRNTYEIRLALFMAKSESKRFVLMVKPDAVVEESIVELLKAQGAELRRHEIASHSVYIGCLYRDGSEEGWVLGDDQSLLSFRAALKSPWLREQIRLGAVIPLRDLLQFGNEMWEESAETQNVDGENVREAMLALMVTALKHEGSLFIQ